MQLMDLWNSLRGKAFFYDVQSEPWPNQMIFTLALLPFMTPTRVTSFLTSKSNRLLLVNVCHLFCLPSQL